MIIGFVWLIRDNTWPTVRSTMSMPMPTLRQNGQTTNSVITMDS